MNAKEKETRIAAGLETLCNQPAEELPVASTREKKAKRPVGRPKGDSVPVCYNIAPDVEKRVRYMAYFDRTTKNAIVEAALREYWNAWQTRDHERMSFEAWDAADDEEKEQQK